MKKPKRRPPIASRVETFASQAYLALSFFDQGDQEGFNTVLVEMQDALDEDKKLANHLFPGLVKLCRDKGLEVHGPHVVKAEKH